MAYQWPPACYVLPYILGKHGPMSLRKTLILLDWCPTQMTSFTRPDSRMRPSLPMAKTETVGLSKQTLTAPLIAQAPSVNAMTSWAIATSCPSTACRRP